MYEWMVNQAHHEASFWNTLHATTTAELDSRGPDLRRELLGQQRVFPPAPSVRLSRVESKGSTYLSNSTDYIPTGLITGKDRVLIKAADNIGMGSHALDREPSYDFLTEGGGLPGTSFLPLFEDSGEDSGTTTLGMSTGSSASGDQAKQDPDTVTPETQDLPPESDKAQLKGGNASGQRGKGSGESTNAGDANSSGQQSNSATQQPLRRGLRARTRPKHYQMSQSDESDGEWAPKRKRSRTKAGGSGGKSRGGQKEPGSAAGRTRTGGPPVVVTNEDGLEIVSDRVERPLPPDLDEKSRRRILRNRASAERSRLKRLGQIAMLEQENQSLRNQLEQARQQAAQGNDWANAWGGSSMNERVLMEENTALKAEGRLLNERVRTLTSLLQAARSGVGHTGR